MEVPCRLPLIVYKAGMLTGGLQLVAAWEKFLVIKSIGTQKMREELLSVKIKICFSERGCFDLLIYFWLSKSGIFEG